MSRIYAQVEVVPLRAGGLKKGRSLFFNDIRSVSTNKSISSGQAGNFEVTFGAPHGRALLADFADNDITKISLKRDDPFFTAKDVLWIGQIDRISSTENPNDTEWTLRGKDLTKQFLTNTIYIQQYVVGPDGQVADPQQIYNTIFAYYEKWGIAFDNYKQINGDGQSLGNGFVLTPFLKQLVTNNEFIDPDLLPGGYDIQADGLILSSDVSMGWTTPANVLEALCDKPFVFWYVNELGKFVFKQWNWRFGVPQLEITSGIWQNSHESITDFKVVAGCSVAARSAYANQAKYVIDFNQALGERYGVRYVALADIPYIYSTRMALRRARDYIQLMYLSRIEASVAVEGSAQWTVDQNVYYGKTGGIYYLDGVQHRFDLKENVDWTTTLSLTYGRPTMDSYATPDAGDATILSDLVNYYNPQTAETTTPVFRLDRDDKEIK